MGRITLHMNDPLEKKFRVRVGVLTPAKKGGIKDAVEEALKDWLKKTKKRAKELEGKA